MSAAAALAVVAAAALAWSERAGPPGVAPVPSAAPAGPPPTPPPPPPGPSPAARPPADADLPGWFRALSAAQRPPAVPDVLRVSEAPGEYVNRRDGSVMRWVPPGRFTWPDELGGRPARLTRGVFLGRDEVTFEQFVAFGSAYLRVPTPPPIDDYAGPHGLIPWNHAQRYCRWAGGRLPTEAEWLRAASDGGRLYPWGDEPRALGLDPRVAPEGCAFGLRALGGGVAEWVQDALLPLPPGTEELVDLRVALGASAPEEPACARRVLRGGAATLDEDAQYALNARRVGVALVPTTEEERRLLACAGVRLAVDAGPPAFAMPAVRWRVTAWEFPQVALRLPVPDPPPLDDLVQPGARRLGPVERDDLDLPFGNDGGPGTLLANDPGFAIDSFAVRAEAAPELEPGRYLVYAQSDDGIVVWVDGRKVIDRWTHHYTAHDVAFFEVDRRRRVELRVDYCELFGGGMLLVELLPD